MDSLESLEVSFNLRKWRSWTNRNWFTTVYTGVIYVALICIGKAYMKTRKPFKLRALLICYNLTLAIFNITPTVRLFWMVLKVVKENELHAFVCARDAPIQAEFWGFLFLGAKVFELTETMFLVLRKKPFNFLHCYRHLTVMIFSCYGYNQHPSYFIPCTYMNFFVQSFVYFYYFLKSLGIRGIRLLSACVTCLKVIQLLLGCVATFYVTWLVINSMECEVSMENAIIGFLMYLSFLSLFFRFLVSENYVVREEEDMSNVKSDGKNLKRD